MQKEPSPQTAPEIDLAGELVRRVLASPASGAATLSKAPAALGGNNPPALPATRMTSSSKAVPFTGTVQFQSEAREIPNHFDEA